MAPNLQISYRRKEENLKFYEHCDNVENLEKGESILELKQATKLVKRNSSSINKHVFKIEH